MPFAEGADPISPTGTSEPFTVTLDLSGATNGDVVMLLVRGGVGLETDPGDFSATSVVVESLPATG